MVTTLNGMLENNDAARKTLKSIPDQHDFSNTVIKMIKVVI
jgi:hypothetical protein